MSKEADNESSLSSSDSLPVSSEEIDVPKNEEEMAEDRKMEELGEKIERLKWGGSVLSDEDRDVLREDQYIPTTLLGFISFLIATKSITLIFYVVLLIVAEILLDNSFLYTIIAFGIAEVILIGLTIFHVIRPTLGVVLCIIGSQSALGLTKAIFGITMELLDGGKDCGKEHCIMLNITEPERFGLFWFCLITALYDFFIALIIISHSPQMHEFETGDEYLF